ncbi:MAG: hypothetical protein ACM3UW_08945, partial [Bacillota bacterium]
LTAHNRYHSLDLVQTAQKCRFRLAAVLRTAASLLSQGTRLTFIFGCNHIYTLSSTTEYL